MKKYRWILLFWLPSLFVLPGCNDWLDVTPQAQTNADKLFSTPKGFENALYGVYTSMTDEALYGKQMTWGLMDVLAQYYTVNTNPDHEFYDAVKYNYDAGNSKDIIRSIWLGAYRSIANCNILLEYLEEKGHSFFPDNNYELLKAEALALRAYLHFDVLRAFAPSWKNNQKGMSIPFADSFTNKIHRQVTTEQILEYILRDLIISREMLKDVDPIFQDQFKDMIFHFNQPLANGLNFSSFRCYRMNYFAVTALLARIYHYTGDLRGYDMAKEIIQAVDEGYFQFTTETEVSLPLKERDVVMQNEILFALNYPDVHQLFNSADVVTSRGVDLSADNILFPINDDLRRNLIGKNSRNKIVSYKFADIKSSKGSKIPMIRISEIYLIAAELGFDIAQTDAVNYLQHIRKMRGTSSDLKVVTKEQLIAELTLEARREFISEGQQFYWYKRLNLPVDRGDGKIELTKQNYTLPMPDAEIEFGDRVEEYLK